MRARFEKISLEREYAEPHKRHFNECSAIIRFWDFNPNLIKTLLKMNSQELGDLIEQVVILKKMEVK